METKMNIVSVIFKNFIILKAISRLWIQITSNTLFEIIILPWYNIQMGKEFQHPLVGEELESYFLIQFDK